MEEINKYILKILTYLKYILDTLEKISFNSRKLMNPEIIRNILKKSIEIMNEKCKNNAEETEVEKKVYEKVCQILFNYEGSLEDFSLSPDFIDSFGISQIFFWINNDFEFINIIKDFNFISKFNKEDFIKEDSKNKSVSSLSNILNISQNQILEIKKKLKINDETLTNIFLSNISVFQKYKNDKEFLFFGLTESIGDKETQKIYQESYFSSKILFIPQYRIKRFIELPPKLSNRFFDDICEDIIINFNKGRKILIVCNSIKDAYTLESYLLKKFDKKDFVLYTGYDKEYYYNYKDKKIILSSGYVMRDMGITITSKEEFNGGLHVILTYMPNNYRLLKQIFGRALFGGKSGTGQIILRKNEYNYSQLFEKMLKKKKKLFMKRKNK